MYMCGHELQKELGAAPILHTRGVVRGAGIPYWVLFLEDGALKLERASEWPAGPLITQLPPCLRGSDSVGLGQAQECASLTNPQVMLMLMVWGPHLENRWGLWPIPSAY